MGAGGGSLGEYHGQGPFFDPSDRTPRDQTPPGLGSECEKEGERGRCVGLGSLLRRRGRVSDPFLCLLQSTPHEKIGGGGPSPSLLEFGHLPIQHCPSTAAHPPPLGAKKFTIILTIRIIRTPQITVETYVGQKMGGRSLGASSVNVRMWSWRSRVVAPRDAAKVRHMADPAGPPADPVDGRGSPA